MIHLKVILDGKNHDIDYMIGCNEDEGQAFAGTVNTLKELKEAAEINFGDKTEELLKIGNVKTDEDAAAFFKTSHRGCFPPSTASQRRRRKTARKPLMFTSLPASCPATNSVLSIPPSSGLSLKL